MRCPKKWKEWTDVNFLVHILLFLKTIYTRSSELFSEFLLLAKLISGPPTAMISQLDCHTYWGFAIDGFPYIYKQLVTNGSHCLPFSKRVDSALTSMFNRLHYSFWFVTLLGLWFLLYLHK